MNPAVDIADLTAAEAWAEAEKADRLAQDLRYHAWETRNPGLNPDEPGYVPPPPWD